MILWTVFPFCVVSLCGGVQEGTLETMAVTHGRKHFSGRPRKMHGWKVSMSFAKGFNTIHSRSAAADAEASEDVRWAMDAATRAAIREELPDLASDSDVAP